MSELRLRSYHEFSGALFRMEAGWAVPAGYGALDREVAAVRRAAGIFDLSDHAKVRVTGSDSETFLDGLVTADLKVLPRGMSAYALVLDEASRVLGDVSIAALDDAYLLDIEASEAEALLAYFRRQIVSDDVTLEDLGFCGHIEVHGPLAARIASSVLGVDAQGLSVDAHTTFPLDRHHRGTVSRLTTFGEDGYAIWAQGDSLALVWDACVRAGAQPVGREALEILRIEAGRPRFGVDMTPQTLALEVVPEGVLSSTKGCYRGQEVVARGLSIGPVTRRFMGLRIEGDVPPNRGDPVLSEAGEVGRVTSACWSPTTGNAIALALLRREAARTARTLFVDRDGWTMGVRLATLPFVIGSS